MLFFACCYRVILTVIKFEKLLVFEKKRKEQHRLYYMQTFLQDEEIEQLVISEIIKVNLQ